MSQKHANRQKAASIKAYRRLTATQLMEFFYSVHYEVGTALEDVVRADLLSRQQAAILWLIRSQGGDACRMRRKDIEANVRRWFEVTSAAVSKSLRGLMHPPLEFIEITEDPRSGREKLVALTAKGKAFLDAAANKAGMLLAQLIEDVPLEVIDHATTYFRHLTGAFQNVQARSRGRLIRFNRQADGEVANIGERESGPRGEDK
jgi:DNA-binding MarR family transcriptional regulator